MPIYYVQECPTCGRSLRVRVAYLGKQVICQHCEARFTAFDPANVVAGDLPADSGSSLMLRVEELLQAADSRRSHPSVELQ